MSRKISEYFSLCPQSDSVMSEKQKFKAEKEVTFEIELKKVKVEPKVRANKIDIKGNFKLFEAISGKDSQNKSYKICKFCGKKSPGKNLKTHMKLIHPNEFNFFNCKICNQKFLMQNFLDRHIKKKHTNGQAELFECDFDGKVFKAKSNLNQHMMVHLPLVKCEICNNEISKRCFSRHQKRFHSNKLEFKCKICAKCFTSAEYLKTHEKIHVKKFKCDICSKKFSMQFCLSKHTKESHENPKSFKCEICDNKYNQKNALTRHLATHDKNRSKSYKCNRCDYTTDMQRYFKEHQNVHDRQDEKFAAMKNPIKCEKCPTFCKNEKALKQHMKYVHPKVLFQCDLCAKFYKTKYNIVYHMMLHFPRTSKN